MTEFVSIAMAFRKLDDQRERIEFLEDVEREHLRCGDD